VYTSVRNVPAGVLAPAAPRGGRIGATVVLLGLTSLFTDLSQEMVVAVLPLYLTFELGLSALQFGLVDGLYQGATAFVRLLGGLAADRSGRHKEVAAAGYGMSAATKLGLLAAGTTWLPVTGLLLVDRLGKGIRTAPRDALISLSTERRSLGLAFGVHRALDTTGALLGPLVAFVLLASLPGEYDSIFVTSFCFALVGLGILVLFVQNRPVRPVPAAPSARPASVRTALGLLGEARFRTIVLAGGGLGLVTVSDAFLYLGIQRDTSMDVRWFPLLFLGTAATYLLLAVPAGRLADRVGRARVFLAGHVALLGVYAALAFTEVSAAEAVLCLGLLGVYYAATDGVLMALASTVAPEGLRTSGLALVTTGTAITRFASSVVFGALWVAWGPDAAVLAFLVGLAAALPAAILLLHPSREAVA
jgi:MFS family permease